MLVLPELTKNPSTILFLFSDNNWLMCHWMNKYFLYVLPQTRENKKLQSYLYLKKERSSRNFKTYFPKSYPINCHPKEKLIIPLIWFNLRPNRHIDCPI